MNDDNEVLKMRPQLRNMLLSSNSTGPATKEEITLGFMTDDEFITNPFWNENMTEEVNPMEYYLLSKEQVDEMIAFNGLEENYDFMSENFLLQNKQ
jgi:hypothetical protein|tara:strand:+ start:455 stop:742 length:288 start_codon:yes stop_codon:yes gene_type:complete